METITIPARTLNVYTYEELSDDAKRSARQWWIELEQDEPYPWCGEVYASLKTFLDLFDITVKEYEIGAHVPSSVALSIDRHDTTVGNEESEDDCIGLTYVRLWKWLHNSPLLYREPTTKKVQQISIAEIIKTDNTLTGYCADWSLLKPIQDFIEKPDQRTLAELIHACVDQWLADTVADMEYQTSEENAEESIKCNEYRFNSDGSFYE